MTSKKIYLIRHGQTDFNLKGVVQGSGIDSSLNEKGKRQAIAFFNAYKHIVFDRIYTSVLRRSMESVQSFIDLEIPHLALEGLNEINWGSQEGHRITSDEDTYYDWLIDQWQKGNTGLRIEGGESPEDVVLRQQQSIQTIMANSEDKNVLVCMHGRAIRIILCRLLNYPLHAMDMFEHQNLGLYLLNFTGSMWSLEKFNDGKHLANLNFTG